MCKTFTKILLLRLRLKFPPTALGQLCGKPGEPLFWMGQAQDRSAWRGTTQDSCTTRCGTSEGFYEDLQFNLHGRGLTLSIFSWLGTHRLRSRMSTPFWSNTGVRRQSISGLDGSSMKSVEGLAVIRKPPAMPLSRSWIRRQSIAGKCTNIR